MTDVMTLHDLLSMKNWAVAKNVTDANQDKFFDEWKRFLRMRETCEKKFSLVLMEQKYFAIIIHKVSQIGL